jgi:MerR family transcriptional regulator/heat shock protein HspR
MTEKKFEQKIGLYVISVAAELAGMHPQTLRTYERKGLLEPRRTTGGSRRYSQEDISMLKRIQELTNEGLNLEGVKRVIELEAEIEALNKEITELKIKLKDEIQSVHRQYKRELVPLKKWLEPAYNLSLYNESKKGGAHGN